jgi:predicted site-specific integrase-resolvase
MTTLYTSAEVATKIRRNRQTVLRYTRKGLIRASKPGGKEYLYTEQAIDDFLRDSETPAPKPVAPKPSRNPRYSK